jgi:integrase
MSSRFWTMYQLTAPFRGASRVPSITVAQYAKQWSTTRPHRSTTATRVKSMIDNHIAGTRLGGRRLSAVRTSEVQAWVTERSQTLSPGTVRLVVQTLRSIFNAAVQDRLLARNPVTRLSMPRSEKQRITRLSVIEVQDLAGAMPERCRAMVITQAGLGLRVAELLALRVENVDFLRRTVRVEFQTTPDGKYRVPPKTPRSRRALPLAEVVGKALAAHIAEFPPTEDGSLFTTANGNLYRHEHYGARIFGPSVKRLSYRLARRVTHCATITPACSWQPGSLWSQSPRGWAMRTPHSCSRRTGI